MARTHSIQMAIAMTGGKVEEPKKEADKVVEETTEETEDITLEVLRAKASDLAKGDY